MFAQPRAETLTEGELWARELLAQLRAERWRPRASVQFLADSLERAAQTKRARPALARQARAWSISGVAAGAAAAALARPRGSRADLVPGAVCWALASGAMLEWHLGMVQGPRGEPRGSLSAADALTYARLLSAPGILACTGRSRFLALLGLGAASDGLDGALARRCGATRLGRDLDTVADLAFFLSAARAARRAGWVTHAALIGLGARELAVAAGSALSYFVWAEPPPAQMLCATRFTGSLFTIALGFSTVGRRRSASQLLLAASAAAVVAHLRALRKGGRTCADGARGQARPREEFLAPHRHRSVSRSAASAARASALTGGRE
jgi:phosphatidylglycerophosphate synthase